MIEFINLRQGGIRVREYTLKFIKLSKYTPSMVANSKDRINKFPLHVSDLVKME